MAKKGTMKIMHRHTHEVIFEYQGTIKEGIEKAIKENVDLRFATFRIVNGEMWKLDKIDWKGKDLENIDLRKCIAHNHNFSGCNLSRANLCGGDFEGSNFENCNFKNTMMTPAKVEGCKFKGVNLKDAITEFTDFSKATGVK